MTASLIVIYAFFLGSIHFLKHRNSQFNLADEGYLWYGTNCLLDNQIPIRDFRAYDPGRYFWTGLFVKIFGNKIQSIRLSMSVMMCLIFIMTMLFLRIEHYSWLVILLTPLWMMVWMHPTYKIIDCCVPIIGIILFSFIGNPPNVSLMSTGLFIGFWAGFTLFIGLNHFLYTSVGLLTILVINVIQKGNEFLEPSWWFILLGVILGLIPMLFFLSIKGVFSSYYKRKIERVLSRKSSNLKLPIYKFWQTPIFIKSKLNPNFFIGLIAYLLPAFFVTNLLCSLFLSSTPNFLAISANVIGLCYLNHFYSRADISHLRLSFLPFILSSIAITDGTTFLVCQLSIGLIFTHALLYRSYIYPTYFQTSFKKRFKSSRLDIVGNPKYIQQLETLHQKIQAVISPNSKVFFAPMCAGWYPIFNKNSYVYDTFPVYPGTTTDQEEMICQINQHQIDFIYIFNIPLDKKESLKFEHTHSMVWKYININYLKLDAKPLANNHCLFIKENP